MVNLKPVLEATAQQSQANLARMFSRMQFISGEQVGLFEQELARAFEAQFAIAVGSGTSAIELSLRVAGLGSPHHEVLVPALTSPFTGLAVVAAGCTPRFADVDPETLLLSPEAASESLTRRTVAVIPVHLYGQPADLAGIAALARKRKLTIVQDACQAHGAAFDGRAFTEYSACAAYSFYPTKNLGCLGDGGAIVTRRPAVADRLRLLHDGGRKGDQVSRVQGVNSRLDEMQACYLRAFLPHLAEWNAHRARIAGLYDQALAGIDGVRPVRRVRKSVNHLYVIRAQRRDNLREHLAKSGIGTAVHYPVPLHLQPAFHASKMRRGELPHAEKACREVLSLPLWPYMPDSAALEVAERIREFYG
jgi:dTDP-3-amino-3,4,6-trideoxy-alpha-D-glucose transaminase